MRHPRKLLTLATLCLGIALGYAVASGGLNPFGSATAAPNETSRFQEEKEDFMAHSYGLGTRAPYQGPTNTGGQFRDNPTGRQIRMAPEATA